MRTLLGPLILAVTLAIGGPPSPAAAQEPSPPGPAERPLPARPPAGLPSPEERHLPPPAPLPRAARELLRTRMARHGRDMSELVRAVILLDYPEASRLARQIAEEPRLARPLGADASELNTALPPAFFELQDELHTRAAALATAARTRDGTTLPRAFGQLTETCVACHRTYVRGP